jgi:hypothetical protein
MKSASTTSRGEVGEGSTTMPPCASPPMDSSPPNARARLFPLKTSPSSQCHQVIPQSNVVRRTGVYRRSPISIRTIRHLIVQALMGQSDRRGWRYLLIWHSSPRPRQSWRRPSRSTAPTAIGRTAPVHRSRTRRMPSRDRPRCGPAPDERRSTRPRAAAQPDGDGCQPCCIRPAAPHSATTVRSHFHDDRDYANQVAPVVRPVHSARDARHGSCRSGSTPPSQRDRGTTAPSCAGHWRRSATGTSRIRRRSDRHR